MILTVKLIFIITCVEFFAVLIFEFAGVSFEGGPEQIDIYFIISAVIIAPIFEETVYRMNASTLLARRLPIIWVAGITATWFIAKHLPMWYFDHNFSLMALMIFLPVDILIWIVVTYYFLKRNCIWIPVIIHAFNNGAIVLFHFLPIRVGEYIEYIMVGIGIVFIFIFVIPKLKTVIIEKYNAGEFKFTTKTYNYLGIAAGLTILLLLTSEALAGIMYLDPTTGIPIGSLICGGIGLILLILSIATIVYIYINRNIVYVK